MRFERSIEIMAPAEHVFTEYADVERWPDWTPSVRAVRRLDDGPLRVGSRAKVSQPRLPVAVWEVTELVPGRSFTWVARAPGLESVGTHAVTPMGDDRCRATARLDQAGPLGPVLGLLTKRLTERYLDLEAGGLKVYCERRPNSR